MHLTVASYNIRKAIGRDGKRDPGRILSVISGFGADIVALQEADFRFQGRKAIFTRAEITAATGLVAVDVSPTSPGLGWHGNMLLLRPPIQMLSVFDILLPGLEPRGAYISDLDTTIGPLRFIGAHLGLVGRNRRSQAGVLANQARQGPEGRAIVAGDFNAAGDWPGSLAPLRFALSEVRMPASFPTRWPLFRFDRMFHSADLTLENSSIIDGREVRRASDHLPIWARFQVRDDESLD